MSTTSINIIDAQPLLTKEIAGVFTDYVEPKGFLRSFFTETESYSEEISIMVERSDELIAVDVIRNTDGNLNNFSRSTEGIIIPPYYDELTNVTSLDAYKALYANPIVSKVQFGRFVNDVAERLARLQAKINRAYEKQCADVLHSGVITMADGTVIDYKRKSASMVDLGAGNYWTGTSVDPSTSLEVAGTFLRTEGKCMGGTFYLICSPEAVSALKNNTFVQNRAKLYQFKLDDLNAPVRNSLGYNVHGIVSSDSFNFIVMSYPQYYKNAAGNNVPYIQPKRAIIIPENPAFLLSYAAVPQLLSLGQTPMKGKFFMYDDIDKKRTAHEYGVRSAGAAIPMGVDQIYTMQVVA